MTVDLASALRRPVVRPVDLPWGRTVTAALVALAVAASVLCGYGVVSGQKRLAVLPAVLVVCVALAVVACTRFSWFVLLLLAIRSSTDALKVSASDAGTSAANTVGERGPDPSSILGVLFLVLALLWLAAVFHSGTAVRASVITAMLLLYVFAGALSVVGSSDVQASALQLTRLVSAGLMFVVLEQLITDRAMLVRVLVACFAALVVPLGHSLVGLATGQASAEVKGGFTRVTGTFTQSNDYARFLTFLLLLGIAVLPWVSRRVKPLLAAVLAVSAVFLLLTLTLGAIGAALAGVVVIALIQRRAGLLCVVGATTLAALVTVPGLLGRLDDSTAPTEVGGGPTGNSLSWRLGYWSDLLTVNRHNPVTGIGLNATQYLTRSAKQPHNDYLSAYVETGVIGLLAYLGLVLAMVVVTGRAVLRTRRDTLEWGVAVGATVCVGAFALMSVAANVIQSSANFWCLLAITACGCAAGRFAGRPDGGAGGRPPHEALRRTGRPRRRGPSRRYEPAHARRAA